MSINNSKRNFLKASVCLPIVTLLPMTLHVEPVNDLVADTNLDLSIKKGTQYFNTNIGRLKEFNGSKWVEI